VFIMSPLQGFRIVGVNIRRLRCASPPVIHDVVPAGLEIFGSHQSDFS
jgi:hypothetical protein